MIGDGDFPTHPDISVPGQYQRAFDPLFAEESFHNMTVVKTWGDRVDDGLAKLNDWPPAEAAAMLRRAIARLPDEEPHGTFWDANPGNVKIFLKKLLRITEYAIENNIEGTWYFCHY